MNYKNWKSFKECYDETFYLKISNNPQLEMSLTCPCWPPEPIQYKNLKTAADVFIKMKKYQHDKSARYVIMTSYGVDPNRKCL